MDLPPNASQPNPQTPESKPEPVFGGRVPAQPLSSNTNSPAQGANPASVPPPNPVNTGKPKSKKGIFVGIVLLLLIAAGVAAWYFLIYKKASPALSPSVSPTTTPQAKKINKIVAFLGIKLYSFDQEGTRAELATIEANAQPLSFIDNGKGGGILYYGVTKKVGSTDFIAEIKSSDGKVTTSLVTITDPAVSSQYVVSRDGAYVSYLTDSNSTQEGVHIYDVKAKKDTIIPDPEDGDFWPVGFSDDGKLIIQKLSCYNCDGPPLPKAYTINPATGAKISEYEATLAPKGTGTLAGYMKLSPDGKKLYIVSTTQFGLGLSAADYAKESYEINQVVLSTGVKTKVYTPSAASDIALTVGGFGDDGVLAYTTVSQKLQADELSDLTFLRLDEFGGPSPVKITISNNTLKTGTIEQAYTIGGKTLYFVTASAYNNPGGRTFTLSHLPYTEKDAKIIDDIAAGTLPITILGFVSETK